MATETCPPCNHNCRQGRDCPARKKMSEGEAREMARDLVRGSIIEDAAAQFIAQILKHAHDERIKPLKARAEAAEAERDALRAERDALADELHTVKTGGILEVANKNNRVTEYMFHWEGRALDAEARVERLEAALKWYSDDPSSQGDVARAALKGDDK